MTNAATQDALALAGQLETWFAIASPGEWFANDQGQVIRLNKDGETRPNIIGSFVLLEDAELAARARNLVPFVVAALRALALEHVKALELAQRATGYPFNERHLEAIRDGRYFAWAEECAPCNALALARPLGEAEAIQARRNT